jgi:hypothetical protein
VIGHAPRFTLAVASEKQHDPSLLATETIQSLGQCLFTELLELFPTAAIFQIQLAVCGNPKLPHPIR